MRRWLVVILLSGCDRVFDLDRVDESGACAGTFTTVCTRDQAGEQTFTANTVIDTTDDPLCAELVDSPPVCAVFATTLTISAGVVVRASGPRALVLVASEAVTIDGTLDVSSTGGNVGAAAGSGTCFAAMLPTAVMDVGAGGAGGSFASLGGLGRSGRTPGNEVVGKQSAPGMAVAPIRELRGGCAGTAGAGGSAASPGAGGGAIAIIAPAIQIAGLINASGGSGAGGGAGRDGGGGGGSGGMIVLEAPVIAVLGHVLANGGGAGEGGLLNTSGVSGKESAGGADVPDGGAGTAGGDGGDGAHRTLDARDGRVPNDGQNGGGGGGGGGAGVVYVIPFQPLNPQVSPPPVAP